MRCGSILNWVVGLKHKSQPVIEEVEGEAPKVRFFDLRYRGKVVWCGFSSASYARGKWMCVVEKQNGERVLCGMVERLNYPVVGDVVIYRYGRGSQQESFYVVCGFGEEEEVKCQTPVLHAGD